VHARADRSAAMQEKMLLVVGRLRGHGSIQRLALSTPRAFEEQVSGARKHRATMGELGGDDGLVAQRIERLNKPICCDALDVQLGYATASTKDGPFPRAALAELHEQQRLLLGNKARALTL